jgi:hypothetical protein
MQNFNILLCIYKVPVGGYLFLRFFSKILLATHLVHLQDQLWNLSKEKVEEEGECEDGTQVRGLERKEDTAVL